MILPQMPTMTFKDGHLTIDKELPYVIAVNGSNLVRFDRTSAQPSDPAEFVPLVVGETSFSHYVRGTGMVKEWIYKKIFSAIIDPLGIAKHIQFLKTWFGAIVAFGLAAHSFWFRGLSNLAIRSYQPSFHQHDEFYSFIQQTCARLCSRCNTRRRAGHFVDRHQSVFPALAGHLRHHGVSLSFFLWGLFQQTRRRPYICRDEHGRISRDNRIRCRRALAFFDQSIQFKTRPLHARNRSAFKEQRPVEFEPINQKTALRAEFLGTYMNSQRQSFFPVDSSV